MDYFFGFYKFGNECVKYNELGWIFIIFFLKGFCFVFIYFSIYNLFIYVILFCFWVSEVGGKKFCLVWIEEERRILIDK